MLGAGGAVKGVMPSLLEAGPAALVIANRTAERAEALAAEWVARPIPVSGGGYSLAAGTPWDVIINGTSTGLSGEMPALPNETVLAEGCCCYDMAYGKGPTPFMSRSAEPSAEEVWPSDRPSPPQGRKHMYVYIHKPLTYMVDRLLNSSDGKIMVGCSMLVYQSVHLSLTYFRVEVAELVCNVGRNIQLLERQSQVQYSEKA